MGRHGLASAFASLALLLGSIAPARAEGPSVPKLPSTKGWVEVRSPQFILYSRAGTMRTRKIAVQLERFRLALSRLTQGFALDTTVPTLIVVFPNDEELTPYKLDKEGLTENISGYFLAGPFQNFVVLDASAGDAPKRVLYHEFFHTVTDATFGELPLWVDEGLAEFYSTFKTEVQGASIQIGHPIPEHLGLLQERGMLPWAEVFATTTRSPAYNESLRQGAFYAQSWLAVYYLAATGEHFKTLSRYLTLLNAGTNPDEAIETATGLTPKAFGARVTEYAKHGRSNVVSWDLGESAAKVEVSDRPLEAPEIYLRLGELQARRGRREEAVRLLEAARAAGAPTAAVEASLGVAAVVSADTTGAESHLRKSIAAGADSPEVLVALGEILMNRESSSPRPAVADARALFRKALEKDATCFPALVAVARTYVVESDPAPGSEAIALARKRRPFDDDAIAVDACLRARAGRPDSASRLVTRELGRADPEVAKLAKSCVIAGTMAAVRDRIQANDVEGAKTTVALAIAAIDDPAARSQFETIQSGLASGAPIVFHDEAGSPEETAHEDAVRKFNEAVKLANAGRTDEGLAILDAIVTACSDPEICERAKQVASELRPVVKRNQWVKQFNHALELTRRAKINEATVILQKLEKEVDDPKLLADVRGLLRGLGVKPARE